MNPSVRLHLGDCLDVLRTLDADSVDAVVQDPPSGISFMSRSWDSDRGGRSAWVAWLAERLAECLRVAKPGAVMLCWAIPRTSHWTATAIEDAGWFIEDCVYHHFGSGFPKHKSKLKPATEMWWLARKPGPKWLGVDAGRVATGDNLSKPPGSGSDDRWRLVHRTEPNEQYPAGRWPPNLCLSHSSQCVRVGTRGVRSGTAVQGNRDPNELCSSAGWGYRKQTDDRGYADTDGLESVEAWECAEGCPVRLMGEQSGERTTNPGRYRDDGTAGMYGPKRRAGDVVSHGDTGTAARYFPNFMPDATTVDEPESSPYNGMNTGGQSCNGSANNAGPISTPNPSTCRGDSDGSAPADAAGMLSGSPVARQTPDDASGSPTADGIASGENRGAAESITNSKTDGSGSRRTGRSPKGTRSTTSITTPPITTCPTSNASPPSGTTTITSGFEKTTGSSRASSIGDAADAGNTVPSQSSTSDGPEPIRDTASHADLRRSGSGSEPIGNGSSKSVGPTIICGSKTEPDARFYPNFPADPDPIDTDPFLYAPKAPRSERWFYCRDCGDAFPPAARRDHLHGHRTPDGKEDWSHTAGHPTQKSQSLMRWLCRLACPPGGTIGDFFMGSGSTGKAAITEGFGFVGIESDPEYHALARKRIDAALAEQPLFAS